MGQQLRPGDWSQESGKWLKREVPVFAVTVVPGESSLPPAGRKPELILRRSCPPGAAAVC